MDSQSNGDDLAVVKNEPTIDLPAHDTKQEREDLESQHIECQLDVVSQINECIRNIYDTENIPGFIDYLLNDETYGIRRLVHHHQSIRLFQALDDFCRDWIQKVIKPEIATLEKYVHGAHNLNIGPGCPYSGAEKFAVESACLAGQACIDSDGSGWVDLECASARAIDACAWSGISRYEVVNSQLNRLLGIKGSDGCFSEEDYYEAKI